MAHSFKINKLFVKTIPVKCICLTECECFGHADECVYNETISQRGLSLNVYGEYDGGGVCIDCKVSKL